MKKFSSLPLAALCLLAALGTASAQVVSIKGSDTLGAQLVPQLAEAFNAKNKDKPVKFEIAAEGSAVAFTALTNGTAHIGMSSRQATPAELAAAKAKGINLKEIVACHDMIVVIVNKANPIKKLSPKEVEKIFTGQVKDWAEVKGMPGEISIYTRNTASGTYKDWQKIAMNGRDYVRTAQKMAGGEQVVEEVSSNKNGIGYVGLAFSDKPGVKGVMIDTIAPLAANAEKYPFSRKCYYYLPENADQNAVAFVEFATSEEGHKIARSLGFVPEE
ncbi:PstS family phosphate ABC transporter substrate-binding protein [Luteolibacter luteus]|uniref:PstS family phosphate ABC transporter substrate-binding protein n=1 Tax=Luteolibacter luteus TaxID=2728835 RepID=A0A858RQ97_9BACT|nr:PstS family phosphate ABC transporter substrate-binding protein [Luteolibacter luteus]QJE98905.1 PstS family phosphate ABC transporter substrate-binding protein [Luteolibacter luteus]